MQSSVPTRWLAMSITPIPGYLTPSSGLCEHQDGMWYTDMGADKTLSHIKYFIEGETNSLPVPHGPRIPVNAGDKAVDCCL